MYSIPNEAGLAEEESGNMRDLFCDGTLCTACLEPVIRDYRTRSYKKDDESLLNLTGAMSRCSREKVLICTQKRDLQSPL